MEADFPKDEEVVPVSTRASARLIEALEKLGVDPGSPVNALDAAAFLLEAISDAVDQVNSEALQRAEVVEVEEKGVVVDCPPHLRHQLGHCDPGCEFCATKNAVVAMMQTDEGLQKVVDILAGHPDPEPHLRHLKLRCGCTMEVPFKPEVGTSYRCPCGKITVVYEGTETAMIPVSYWAPDESFFTEPTEQELEVLDEVTHAASCAVWNENEETDCDCFSGANGDGHDYDHGGEG